jgi:glyceraldehyde-3-phosphate dehydrogenase type I
VKIAINGFGRIGRNFLRTILQDTSAQKKLSVVVINIGPANTEFVAHMFKYDTLLGIWPGVVSYANNKLVIDGKSIDITAKTDAKDLNWAHYGIDWVVDATGAFTKRDKAELHVQVGAGHVLITAPAEGDDVTIIPGVNSALFDSKKHKIVSLGSCTTNAFMPMLKVLNDSFGITQGFMTTVHAYTNSQVLLDVEAHSLRLSRAAALNIIPSTTGAARTLEKVLPELAGIVKAGSIRVPVGKVSLIDLVVTTKKEISREAINTAFKDVSSGSMKGIVSVSYEPLVSTDYSGNPFSVTIDAELTDTTGTMAHVFGWYDNEWGYSERLKDFLTSI